MYTDNAITNAFYVDPATFAISPCHHRGGDARTPYTTISPRFDYQFSTNNTLTVRFEERFNSRDNAGTGRHQAAAGFSVPLLSSSPTTPTATTRT